MVSFRCWPHLFDDTYPGADAFDQRIVQDSIQVFEKRWEHVFTSHVVVNCDLSVVHLSILCRALAANDVFFMVPSTVLIGCQVYVDAKTVPQ